MNKTLIILLTAASLVLSCGDKKPEACNLTPDAGDCLAAIPRYYYNQQTGQCEMFIWGGCGGVVPFETLQECEACECHN